MLRLRIGMVVALAVGLSDMPPRAHGQPPRTGVSKIDRPVSSKPVEGVVEKIDADGLTLVERRDNNVTVTHKLVPIDVLRDGNVLNPEGSSFAYRWKDVKQGDSVDLRVVQDEGDEQTYCLEISILRRPGGKLPESQDPERDRGYTARRIFNDIENGDDVSDEELLKVFPPRYDQRTGKTSPGGLNGTGYNATKYAPMLDANRKRIAEEKAAKGKELKAKPAEKTGDKR